MLSLNRFRIRHDDIELAVARHDTVGGGPKCRDIPDVGANGLASPSVGLRSV
jgi:hypothetical protein